MKKIIALALVTVSLASCGQKKEQEVKITPTTSVKVEAPIDALKANQISFIEKLDSLIVYKEKGTTDWKMKFDVTAKEAMVKWELNYDFKFDQKVQSSAWKFDIKFDADVKEPKEMKIDWEVSAELAAFKKKVFFKLAKLTLNSSEKSQEIAMVNWMAQAYLWKWYFTDLPEVPETKQIQKLQENFIENKNKVVAIIKKYPIFKSIKENKNGDFYDNDVEVNKESIVAIAKEMTKEFAEEWKKEISADEITEIEKNIEEFNKSFKSNLKIDKKDLKFFVLTINNEDVNFKIENTKEEFIINSSDKASNAEFSYNWKKSDNSLNWIISIKESWEEKFNWNLLLEKKGDKYTFDLKWKIPDQDASFNFNITSTTTEKSVTIEEPKNATDLKEAMWAMMWAWMWAPAPAWLSEPMPVPSVEK